MRLKLFWGKRSENGAIAPKFLSTLYNRSTRARKKQVDARFSGRSDLAECCLDTPLFLNAVYNKRTQVKKQQVDRRQYGRSMVEMLGVLAIIGVLSVGGLAGYAKAMSKYKMTKAADQISMISSNIATAFINERDYSALGSDPATATATAIELNLIPEDMINSDKKTLTNIYSGNVQIYSVAYGNLAHGAFTIEYEGLPREATIFFATPDSNIANSTMMNIKIN